MANVDKKKPLPKALKRSAAMDVPPLPIEGKSAVEHTQTTFDDWGQRLPIGHIQNGQLYRNFKLAKFTMREERAIEGLRKARGNMSLATFVAEILGKMLVSYGPWDDFQELEEGQRLHIISNAWLGDVMYMYLYLRITAIGPDMKFDVTCPSCQEKARLPADLGQTDVIVAEDLASLSRNYELRDGVEVGIATVKSLVIQPPRWQAMDAMKGARSNHGDVKLSMILSSIRQLGDGKRPATMDIMETIGKRDLELLTKYIDQTSPGPDLVLEATCPQCGHVTNNPLNWNWDFLFTASSL